jgi:hypothetical protein
MTDTGLQRSRSLTQLWTTKELLGVPETTQKWWVGIISHFSLARQALKGLGVTTLHLSGALGDY